MSKIQRASRGSFVFDGGIIILLADGEDGPTRRAAEFLAGDIEQITGVRPVVGEGVPQARQRAIFIASADNPQARQTLEQLGVDTSSIEGQWEAYLFKRAGEQVVICGADRLATMRGVYGFCRLALGVDPLHRWTQQPPERRQRIELVNIDRVVPSPTFKFRGWFLNAGHLIRWNMNHGPAVDIQAKYGQREGDKGISGSFGREMAEMIYEAALRSDMNFIIPLSYLDVDDPDERLVADVADEFGLFLSHHHQEPLGANLRVWKDFWANRGEAVPDMSFYKNPQAFETWWGHYAEQWSKYERVVWVIGHRGPGDRPFWIKDEFCPDTMEAHGKAVSEAMEMQIRLIKQASGERPIHYCATLWQDGAPMHAAGVLRFPPGTMVVMADAGSKQLMREDFYKVVRRPELEYGVYYHVCYGPGGPIWAQGNSPDRMSYALREVVEKGDTALALLNVGNIRPYFPGLACWSAITTQAKGFEAERFLLDWCVREFGQQHADAVLECYNMFFASFAHPYYPLYDGHRGFWDGVLTNETWRMCQLMYSGDAEAFYPRVNRPFPTPGPSSNSTRTRRPRCAGRGMNCATAPRNCRRS